jgi:hypothetical protein
MGPAANKGRHDCNSQDRVVEAAKRRQEGKREQPRSNSSPGDRQQHQAIRTQSARKHNATVLSEVYGL